jgi:two-component system LytT family sensor kinase
MFNTFTTSNPEPKTVKGDTTTLPERRLLTTLIVFWGVVACTSIYFGWDSLQSRPIEIWRPLLADASGALLSILIAFNLGRTRNFSIPVRACFAMLLSIVGVFVYAIVGMITLIPILPFVPDDNVAIQIGRMMVSNYWIFLAWSALVLVLESGGSTTHWPEIHKNDLLRLREQKLLKEITERLSLGVERFSGLTDQWFWSYQAVFWSVMFVFSTANMLNDGENLGNIWRIFLVEFSALILTSIAHFGGLKHFVAASMTKRALIAIGLAVLLVACYILMIWTTWFQISPVEIYRSGQPVDTGWSFFASVAPRWLFLNFGPFVGWFGFYFALETSQRIRYQEKQLYNSTMLAQDAQLKMLRFQLNPHFLFNTLNAISTLVMDQRNDDADAMLLQLSRFLRFALDATPGDRVTLSEEFEAQRLYLEIEKVRFADRLLIELNAPDDTLDAQLPSLILQPLVENAIKYGVSRSTSPVLVQINASRKADQLVIDVMDDGPGMMAQPSGSIGVGLQNIRARLAVLYGDQSELSCKERSPNGFAVRLTIPFEIRKTESLTDKLGADPDAHSSG